ncbi:zinc metallopeptidase [Papillibacter cinnamivorans]|uniref:Neutral zinc metallopeptidase n=1 Tax=Papillibacter cinnamivorans DSM 12816 TaxID=1122930 RepID=A0A1W1YVP2_9FIRM|nr:zinc metallopeptidase [Papillibacter cinnamivorans]SMC40295.1 hypothetical protein SAMN02745168_0712 [Papillibacter cinnamivorans DSM 12816]
MYFYYDYTYWIILLPALALTIWAQWRISSNYRKYSQIRSAHGPTGADAAREVLRMNGVQGVDIQRIPGNLTDNYDPRDNVIRLSAGVYDSPSIAAVGVAAHEAGHAVQYAVNYGPIRLRQTIIPLSRFGSQLAFVCIILGLLFNSQPLFGLGIIFFAFMVAFQLVTLPVEFNASHRALEAIESGHLLLDDEVEGARKVLSAAALTYVAALLVSLAQLLRFMLLFSGRRRN